MEIVANSARDGVDFQGGKHEDAEWITSVPAEKTLCYFKTSIGDDFKVKIAMNLKYFKNVLKKRLKLLTLSKNKALQSVKQFFPLPPRIVTAS